MYKVPNYIKLESILARVEHNIENLKTTKKVLKKMIKQAKLLELLKLAKELPQHIKRRHK